MAGSEAAWQLAERGHQVVLHEMRPDRYEEPTSWIDSRAGARTGTGTSVREVVEAIAAMLDVRAPGKSLFIVVD